MNPIETITRAMRGVLNTPQGQFYLGVGFPGFEGTPPPPREKEQFLQTVKDTTDTMQANRPSVRDELEALFAQRSPATPRVLHLVSLLSRMARVCHVAGMILPTNEDDGQRTVGEWGTLETYFTGWLFMIQEYFPAITIPPTIPSGIVSNLPIDDVPDTPVEVADTTPADTHVATSTVEAIRVDRDRLAGCFKGGFKGADPITNVVPFDRFHDDFVARVPSFTTTDIGRVAHQVRASKWAVSRIKAGPFSKWLREFCGICGATVPADTSPRAYRKTTPATDFSAWLQ